VDRQWQVENVAHGKRKKPNETRTRMENTALRPPAARMMKYAYGQRRRIALIYLRHIPGADKAGPELDV